MRRISTATSASPRTGMVSALDFEGAPLAAFEVDVRAGGIDPLHVEVAHGGDVVGEAPGQVAVAPEVDAGRPGVDGPGHVERAVFEGQLGLEPLPRLPERVVGVAAQDGVAGAGAGAGDGPVVAALAGVRAAGDGPRGPCAPGTIVSSPSSVLM